MFKKLVILALAALLSGFSWADEATVAGLVSEPKVEAAAPQALAEKKQFYKTVVAYIHMQSNEGIPSYAYPHHGYVNVVVSQMLSAPDTCVQQTPNFSNRWTAVMCGYADLCLPQTASTSNNYTNIFC